MSEEVLQFWQHAQTAMDTAGRVSEIDPSTAANRAYYAAFYAVSALFAAEGKTFKRHAAVETAVHRDLINTGRWPKDLGTAYSQLNTLRVGADYDVSTFPSIEEAQTAVEKAQRILAAVRNSCPELQ